MEKETSKYYKIDQHKKGLPLIGYAEADRQSNKFFQLHPEFDKSPEIEGLRLEIPRGYIFGIQRKDEYDPEKEKLAKQEFAQKGKTFLTEYPVILCALPGKDLMQLALIDGHHRTRYAGQFRIREIPSIIYTPEQAANLLNQDESISSKELFTAESFTDWMEYGIKDALHSFKDMPTIKNPGFVRGVNSIEELSSRFKSF